MVCLNFNDDKGIVEGGRSCAGGESHRNRIRRGRMRVNSRDDGGGGGGGCTQRGARQQEQEGGKGGASSYGHDDGAGARGAFWSWVSVLGDEICICSSAAGVATGGHRQLATTGDTRPPRLPSDIRLVIRQVRSDAARSTQIAPRYRHRRTKPQKLKHRENQLHAAPRSFPPGSRPRCRRCPCSRTADGARALAP